MKTTKRFLLAAILALALAFTFSACGGGSTPEAIAEKYSAAGFKQDYKTMRNLSTEKGKKAIDLVEKMMTSDFVVKNEEFQALIKEMKSYKPKAKEPAAINDNSATVKISYQGKRDPIDRETKEITKIIYLVKENETWKVDGAR
ncbi:hypothetical protein R83H12_00194 [Fibrobacteria bacterium R8-3-H12]